MCFGDPVYFLIKWTDQTIKVGQGKRAVGGTRSQRLELLLLASPCRRHKPWLLAGTKHCCYEFCAKTVKRDNKLSHRCLPAITPALVLRKLMLEFKLEWLHSKIVCRSSPVLPAPCCGWECPADVYQFPADAACYSQLCPSHPLWM